MVMESINRFNTHNHVCVAVCFKMSMLDFGRIPRSLVLGEALNISRLCDLLNQSLAVAFTEVLTR